MARDCPPLLILLVGTGIYLTLKLGIIQVAKLPLAIKYIFMKEKDVEGEGDVSSFAALCTALAATIGTGNIVGVATAVKAGEPGAIFWMWIAAFFGISVALLGIGTFPQVNAITDAVKINFNVPVVITGFIIAILVALVTLGGIKSISKVAEFIVPFMAALYIIGAVIILIYNKDKLPSSVELILKSAFSTSAAMGGFLGATVKQAIQNGIARGVFSNESGLGSAPIAAAAAKTNSCVKQGLISMTGTFFDTIIICTMTGLVLVTTGMWQSDYSGAAMTNEAFKAGMFIPAFGQFIVTVGLLFFAFTTILGWNYYGERCVEYLFGVKAIKIYKYIFIIFVATGSLLKLDLIWIVADIVNGLMALPNLIAIIGLSSIITYETREYFKSI